MKRYEEVLKTQQAGKDAKRFRSDLQQLPFHSDQGATDLIALLSLSTSKAGGASQWVSGVAIHNELLRRGRKVGPGSGVLGCRWILGVDLVSF